MRQRLLHRLLTSDAPAVQRLGSPEALSYRQLGCAVAALQGLLIRETASKAKPRLRVGLFMPNGPEWVCADLALLLAGHCEIPVPLEFTPEQASSLLKDVDVCLVTPAERDAPQMACVPRQRRIVVRLENLHCKPGESLSMASDPARPPRDPAIAKAIHTSGTTSEPEGVLLSFKAIEAKVDTLSTLIGESRLRRYLSLVPLSLLLEQICGIYLTLSAGGTLILLPTGEKPLTGGGHPAGHFIPFLRKAQPTFMVVPPAVVEAMKDHALEGCLANLPLRLDLFGTPFPPLIACGGAPIARTTLETLAGLGLDIFEGYGLSETASAVSWNLPGSAKLGSVGRPLPDCEVALSGEGELLVRTSTPFSGYLGADPGACAVRPDGFLETGDLASIDEDGFIHIRGRRKNVFINSAGRNVSAEWIEGILAGMPEIQAAVVFGEGQAHPVAMIVPGARASPEAVLRAVARANARLPDYARIRNFTTRPPGSRDLQPFFTITGRPRRDQLGAAFSQTIAELSRSIHPYL